MSKTITNNARSNDQVSVLHLFEFDMYNFDGTFKETLRFTDHQIFVDDGTNEFTPLAITFDTLKEDSSMQSDSISITIDNVSGAITAEALASEWRSNRASIKRVIFVPPEQTLFDETYEYGYGDFLDGYPKLDLTTLTRDEYILFDGIIDTFNANENVLNGTITSLFVNWFKKFPDRTFNQTEFSTIVDSMAETTQWGY